MKLKKFLSIFSPELREPSRCEACGGSFVCGATLTGCWCAEITVSAEVRARLRTLFKGCLCRACLERFAREGVPNTTVAPPIES